jgi:gliding motility-associated-like protein
MKKIIFIAIAMLCISQTRATHIVGGELNYLYLGSDQYRIELNVYFDCLTGSPSAILADSLSRIGIFDENDIMVQQIDISYGGPEFLSGLNYACIVSPPNLCVMKRTYIDTVTLPNITGGYTLAFQRCCRNNSIINITAPGSEGATFWTTIRDTTIQGTNSNPVFNNLPPIGLCVDAPFVWDHSATDIDGDSLVYELFQPYSYVGAAGNVQPNPVVNPPFTNVTWQATYSTPDMMATVPPLTINSQTGQINVTPDALGQYVVGIMVKEYRNGVQIGETRRDYQFNVVQCNFTVVSAFTAPVYNCSNTVDFVNNSAGADGYIWEFGDTTTAGLDTTSILSPSYTYPGPGEYFITLIALDTNCTDTFETSIVILPDFYLNAQLDTTVCPGSSFPVGEPNAGPYPCTYTWTPPTWLSNTTVQNPITTPGNDIVYYVSKTVGNCTQTDTVNVVVVDLEPTDFIYSMSQTCENVLVQTAVNDSLNQFNNFFWTFADSPTSIDTVLNLNPANDVTNLGDTLLVHVEYLNSGCVIQFDTALVTPANLISFKDPTPNVFTPNGDAINPCFEVSLLPPGELRCFTLYIYNRWGVKIYESKEGNCWDGKDLNGTPMTEGVYYYVIESNTYNKSGFLHLFLPN